MITDMRDSVSSWPVRIVLIVLIISFVSFYGSSSNNNVRAGNVAEVNGESIRQSDFQFQYKNVIQSYQKQGKLPQDIPENLHGMIQQQLLASMIYQKLKSFEAKKMGLVASNENVKDTIKKQFSDADGKFDFKFYEAFLRNNMGKTPGQYEEFQRENIRANLFDDLILETGLASNMQVKESYKKNNEKISLLFIKVNEKNFALAQPKTKPTSTEELKKYYDENQEEFKTKEKRNLEIAYYEKYNFTGSNFEKDAEALLKTITEKNQSLAQASKADQRLRHVTTGMVSYDDAVPNLTSADLTEVLNASQNLDIGKSSVVVSRDGSKAFLVRLIETKPSALPAFEKVRPEVEKSYAIHQNKEAFKSWVNASWNDISSGKLSIETFAKKIGAPVKTTQSFAINHSDSVPEIGSNEEIMDQVFQLSPEKPYISSPVQMGDDYILVKLKNKSEPDWKKFETEYPTLADALYQQNAQSRFTAWMQTSEKHAKIKRNLGSPAGGVQE